MDIEVGDFVRTNDGQIGKLKRIERDDIDTSLKWYVFYDGKNERYINKTYIVKHSKNIIDLIEECDYVNGLEVYKGKIVNIKTILTHEQYERNCYRLEE